MPLLPNILSRSGAPFLLFQSSTTQSSLPLLRDFITNTTKGSGHTLLFSFLYPPSELVPSHGGSLQVHDHLANVPGYTDDGWDPRKEIPAAVDAAPPGPLNVIIDSVDTLASDIGSVSQTYLFLFALISQIRARNDSSSLTLHLTSPSELAPLLIQPSFSRSLTHIITHPPVLLTHLTTAFLAPPPPISSPTKFWAVFLPFSERTFECDRLVFGPGGEGSSYRGENGTEEVVVQILVPERTGRRKTVERVLEGWSSARGGACELADLRSLKAIFTSRAAETTVSHVTQNLTFNLNLTSSQQQSKDQVTLPYAHEGNPSANAAQIFYDPDSADDLDDDDPDEDLDI